MLYLPKSVSAHSRWTCLLASFLGWVRMGMLFPLNSFLMSRESSVTICWFHRLHEKVTCVFLKSNPSCFHSNMFPILEYGNLIQSNYQTNLFLFPLHNCTFHYPTFFVCNILICSLLTEILGQAEHLHAHTVKCNTGLNLARACVACKEGLVCTCLHWKLFWSDAKSF